MKKEEAIILMKEGQRITHRYFDPNEWMTMNGNKIELEDGVKCSETEFWHWRTQECWNDGYSLYVE